MLRISRVTKNELTAEDSGCAVEVWSETLKDPCKKSVFGVGAFEETSELVWI